MAVILKKNEERRIKNGHLWVFSNEIAKIQGAVETGDIVKVVDASGTVLGNGFLNKNSLINVRLLGKSFNGDLQAYFSSTISNALAERKLFYPNRESFRLIFSESDFMPGLIIDKYNNTYVLQVYSFAMQKNIKLIVDILRDELKAENIFTSNESYFRKLEGLDDKNEVYLGQIGEEIIDDGKIKYKIKFSESQKTGFFFDQCDNREFSERLVKGKRVLDAYCNSGGFGLHAALANAGMVTFVDSSASEIQNAKHNLSLNGINVENEFVNSDVFEFLEKCSNANRKFDVVMVDPPAFAKSRKSFPSALKGYTKLNKMAMSVVNENGFLVTSSCSHHVKQADFLEAVASASFKAGRQIQQVHFNGASLDHPRLPAMEETSYLKFAVFKVF